MNNLKKRDMNKEKEKTWEITNFIGVYDNYISPEQCNQLIKMYEEQDKFNKTINRLNSEKTTYLKKTDQQYFLTTSNLDIWFDELKPLIANFDLAWKHYSEKTGAEEAYGHPVFYTTLKIQKTHPTEGYHVWHVEHAKGIGYSTRAFVFSIFLNDVEEGGETEFLHFSKRVKPKTGRIIIWPAGFPYVHRGNPPLSGEKFLLTSWKLLNTGE